MAAVTLTRTVPPTGRPTSARPTTTPGLPYTVQSSVTSATTVRFKTKVSLSLVRINYVTFIKKRSSFSSFVFSSSSSSTLFFTREKQLKNINSDSIYLILLFSKRLAETHLFLFCLKKISYRIVLNRIVMCMILKRLLVLIRFNVYMHTTHLKC